MSINIVFMGTPDFALPPLQGLLDADYTVGGVFTQPDRPRGRGEKVSFSPVKQLALKYDLPVYQPKNSRDGTALSILKELKPDLIVVVAYGQILPKEILDLPPLGCINVHGSLLPQLRGAAPIQWSVLNGDTVTGITTMYMDVGMDTGDMILKREVAIDPEETGGALFDRLAPIGAELLLETLPLLIGGTAPRVKQEESSVTYAPRITKEMGEMDFSKSPKDMVNLIRGLSPWPTAYTFLKGERVILHKARIGEGTGSPGEVLDPKSLTVACGDGAIEILEIQSQGRGKTDGASFSNGKRLAVGEKFISPSYSV